LASEATDAATRSYKELLFAIGQLACGLFFRHFMTHFSAPNVYLE
jgi:hypothetical protein